MNTALKIEHVGTLPDRTTRDGHHRTLDDALESLTTDHPDLKAWLMILRARVTDLEDENKAIRLRLAREGYGL